MHEKEDKEQIYFESSDALINVLSIGYEFGLDSIALASGLDSTLVLTMQHADWNTEIQALRKRYTRNKPDYKEAERLTKGLVQQILNYANSNQSLIEILKGAINKFDSRKEIYRPDIELKNYIQTYSNFPIEGIDFKDISPLLSNPEALDYAVYEMANSCRKADVIAGLDSRGFIFGSLVAKLLNKPFVMIRKKGKLPGKKIGASYGLEYGKDEIEIQEGVIKEGNRVAIIDDLLATGGTINAAIELVEKLGGIINNLSFLISLDDEGLKNSESRKKLEKFTVDSLLIYD